MLQRMKSLYQWRPLVKKGQPLSSPLQEVPQFNGIPGWILCTHDEQNRPRVLWTERGTTAESLDVGMDERVCGDTIFRAIRLSPRVFLLADIWVFNAENIHHGKTFADRQAIIAKILDYFHEPDLTAFVHMEDVPVGTLIRGYESYDGLPGSIGSFSEHKLLPAQE